MVCSEQTKLTASQVAIIATYMQPVKLCRIILYKPRSVYIPRTVIAIPPVEEDSTIFEHELICETILDNHHIANIILFENLHNYTKYLTIL